MSQTEEKTFPVKRKKGPGRTPGTKDSVKRKPGSGMHNNHYRPTKKNEPPIAKEKNFLNELHQMVSETSSIARNNEGEVYEPGNTLEKRMIEKEISSQTRKENPTQQQPQPQQNNSNPTPPPTQSQNNNSSENNSSTQQPNQDQQQQQQQSTQHPDQIAMMLDSMLIPLIAKFGKRNTEELKFTKDQFEALRGCQPPGGLNVQSWWIYFLFAFGLIGSNFSMAARKEEKQVSMNDLVATLKAQGFKIEFPEVNPLVVEELRKRGWIVEKPNEDEILANKLRERGYTVAKMETYVKEKDHENNDSDIQDTKAEVVS